MKNNELNAVKEHWEDVKTVSLKLRIILISCGDTNHCFQQMGNNG